MSKQYLAEHYFKLDDRQLALNNLFQAKSYYTQLPIELSRLLNISAIMQHKIDNNTTALNDINEGLMIAERQGLNRERKLLLSTKKDILSQIGDQRGIEKINEIEQIMALNKS